MSIFWRATCRHARVQLSDPVNLQEHIELQLVEYIWWGSADFGNDTDRCTTQPRASVQQLFTVEAELMCPCVQLHRQNPVGELVKVLQSCCVRLQEVSAECHLHRLHGAA